MNTDPVDSPLMRRKMEMASDSTPSLTQDTEIYTVHYGKKWYEVPQEAQVFRRMSTIDRYRIIQQLKELGREGLGGKGAWLILNYQRLNKEGLTPVGTLAFDVLTEEQWRYRIAAPMLDPIGLEVKALRHGREEEYCVPLDDEIIEGETVVVRYWGFEISDNKDGEGDGDPRAQMLCEALTEQTFPWPYQTIAAQVAIAETVDITELERQMEKDSELAELAASLPLPKSLQPGSMLYAPSREALLQDINITDSPAPDAPPGSPTPIRAGKLKPKDLASAFGPSLAKGRMERDDGPEVATPKAARESEYVPHEEHDAREADAINSQLRDEEKERHKAGWYAPAASEERVESPSSEPRWVDQKINHLEAAAEFKAEAMKLDEEAIACRALGDQKTAYSKSAEAIELALKADAAEKAHAEAEVERQRIEEEEKTYFPPTEYQYPDGTVRSILAGWYTEDEHMARTLEEQELLTAVRSIAEKDSMTKYESPLTRTPSQADSMTVAESLREAIAHKSERARNVMATIGSREPSPPSTPSMPSADAPPLPQGESTLLPVDVMTAKMTGMDIVGADLMARAIEVVKEDPPVHINTEDGYTEDQAALTLAAFSAITGVAPENAVAEAHRRYGHKGDGAPGASSEA